MNDEKMSDWRALTDLTDGAMFTVERVRLADRDIAIEGRFEPPPLARLTADEQAFVAAFVHCHGSIRQMEKWFGVSYPTIKNRLNRLAAKLEFVEVDTAPQPKPAASRVLDGLEAGDITAAQAIAQLTGRKGENDE